MTRHPTTSHRRSNRVLWHYFSRQLVILVVVTSAVTIPVVFAYLLPILGPVVNKGLPLKFVAQAIPSYFPLITYLSLPVCAAIAVGRFYDQKVNDNEVTALLTAGNSKLSVALPGILLCLFSMCVGFIFSLYLSPKTITVAYGVAKIAKYYVSFRGLQEGIYTEVSKDMTIYIHKWRTKTIADNIWIYDTKETTDSRFISAKQGEFLENDNVTVLILKDGRIDVFSHRTNGYRSVEFKRLSHHMPGLGSGSLKTRTHRGPREQTTRSLFDPPQRILAQPEEKRKWRNELYRRLTGPVLSLSYGLFCLGVLLSQVTSRRQRHKQVALLTAAVAAVHLFFFAFLVGFDMHSIFSAFVFLTTIMAPLAIGIVLLNRTWPMRDQASAKHQEMAQSGVVRSI